MSQLKIGVVGYGNWGKNHVRVLSELNLLEGVYDKFLVVVIQVKKLNSMTN